RDEAALQAHRGRRVLVDSFKQAVVDSLETLTAAQCCRRANRARRNMGWMGNAALDHPEPGHGVTRVHSDNPPYQPHHHHLLASRMLPRGENLRPPRTAPALRR